MSSEFLYEHKKEIFQRYFLRRLSTIPPKKHVKLPVRERRGILES